MLSHLINITITIAIVNIITIIISIVNIITITIIEKKFIAHILSKVDQSETKVVNKWGKLPKEVVLIFIIMHACSTEQVERLYHT